MNKPQTDLLLAGSPVDLIEALRMAAQRYRQDASDLKSVWQDDSAGAIWDFSADLLEVAATKIEKKWSQI